MKIVIGLGLNKFFCLPSRVLLIFAKCENIYSENGITFCGKW